jgi:hypothetical protein
MARELGLNPTKLGKLDNHQQEPWKAPLPQFIEHLYAKQFGRERPDVIRSIEETARRAERRRAERRAGSTSHQSTVESVQRALGFRHGLEMVCDGLGDVRSQGRELGAPMFADVDDRR